VLARKKRVRFDSISEMTGKNFTFYLRPAEARVYRHALEAKAQMIRKVMQDKEISAEEARKQYPRLLSNLHRKDPYCALFYQKLREKTGFKESTIATNLNLISRIKDNAEAKSDSKKK
jgi:hypothetical protein